MSTRLTIQPDQMFGAYRIERRLSTDLIYSTFSAVDVKRERPVQIQLCHDLSLNDSFVKERLNNEGRSLLRLNNPFVRRLYALTEHDGRVMLIGAPEDGVTLDHYLLGHVTSMADLIDLFRQALEGLRAIHDTDALHRDLRPLNVVVGSGSALRLTGFGLLNQDPLAAALALEAETPGQMNYLAPELINGKPATRESDVYALGLILYHLLTLDTPFAGQDVNDVREKIMAAPLTFAPRLSTLIPVGLVRILNKMTAKNPAGRYPDVAAVLKDLTEVNMDALPVELRESNASGRAIVNFSDLRKRGETLGLDAAEFRFVAAIAAARPATFVSGENGVLISLATFLEAAAIFRLSKTPPPKVRVVSPPASVGVGSSLANALSGIAVAAATFYVAWVVGLKSPFLFLSPERKIAAAEAADPMIEPPRHHPAKSEDLPTPPPATSANSSVVNRLGIGFNVHFDGQKSIALVATDGELEIWQSEDVREVRTQNPFLPSVESKTLGGELTVRAIGGDKTSGLVIRGGSQFTNTIEPQVPTGSVYTITCVVGSPSDVKVAAGVFNCLRVECAQDGDNPSRTVYQYAPKLGYWVRSETQPGGHVVELQNFGITP